MLQARLSILFLIFLCGLPILVSAQSQAKKVKKPVYKVLIIDGQNNHKHWPETTKMMKGYLEETGLFTVEVATTPKEGESLDNFKPDFAKYDVILSNYNGAPWPESTNKTFETYVKNGGGVVIVHAANNAFGEWPEYNKMIGLGGWGGRNEKSGPYVYYDEQQAKFVYDKSPGPGGNHGSEHAFQVKIRNTNHPITKGMPQVWLHEKDELYHGLRGPAENMQVLATAYSSPDQKGSGRHEPMMMVLQYGKGRIFHTPMGHGVYTQKGIGFITTLQRGTEWAASGKVTQKIPENFPTADKGSVQE